MAKLGDADKLFAFKDTAWRSIFWVSLPPGILFVIGSFMVAESPRWLFRRGKIDAARAALAAFAQSNEQTEIELQEMAETVAAEKAKLRPATKSGNRCCAANTSFRFCWPASFSPATRLTGVNSIIGYNATILIQAGLGDKQAHLGNLIFTLVNFLVTIGAVAWWTAKAGNFCSRSAARASSFRCFAPGLLFHKTEKLRVDCQRRLASDGRQRIKRSRSTFNAVSRDKSLLGRTTSFSGQPATLVVIYSYGDFRAATTAVRSDDVDGQTD